MVRLNKPPATLPTTLPGNPEAKFSELDEREARFVIEYAARSGGPGTGADAALAAGYSNSNRDAAHSMASRLLRRPAVLRAIKEELRRRIMAGTVIGVATLESLARSARSEQVRLSAANSLIDRGVGPVVSKNANLNVNTSIEDLISALDESERAGNNAGVIEQLPLPAKTDR